jgi:hypothetical protein
LTGFPVPPRFGRCPVPARHRGLGYLPTSAGAFACSRPIAPGCQSPRRRETAISSHPGHQCCCGRWIREHLLIERRRPSAIQAFCRGLAIGAGQQPEGVCSQCGNTNLMIELSYCRGLLAHTSAIVVATAGVIDTGHCPVSCCHRAVGRAQLIRRASQLIGLVGHGSTGRLLATPSG